MLQNNDTSNKSPQQEPSAVTPEDRQPMPLHVVAIIGFLVISQLAYGIYSAKNLEPSGPFGFLHIVLLLGLVGYWLEHDSRKHHIKWVYDLGFFILIAWPVIIPFYLFKTRRWKAVSIILSYIGLCLGSNLLGRLLATLFLGGQMFYFD